MMSLGGHGINKKAACGGILRMLS